MIFGRDRGFSILSRKNDAAIFSRRANCHKYFDVAISFLRVVSAAIILLGRHGRAERNMTTAVQLRVCRPLEDSLPGSRETLMSTVRPEPTKERQAILRAQAR